MKSFDGTRDATVLFLSDAGAITDQFNMHVISIQSEHAYGQIGHVTIDGFVEGGSSHRSDSAHGLLEKAVKVIYNPPATIAIWADGSKTVVKCDKDDVYDPKYGLALCYMKKALGSSRAFNDALRAGRGQDESFRAERGQDESFRVFLKKHRIVECVMKYDSYENICPIEACPCYSCPYKDIELNKCTKLIREDIKKMREGKKHG